MNSFAAVFWQPALHACIPQRASNLNLGDKSKLCPGSLTQLATNKLNQGMLMFRPHASGIIRPPWEGWGIPPPRFLTVLLQSKVKTTGLFMADAHPFALFMEDLQGPVFREYFDDLRMATLKAQDLADIERVPFFVFSFQTAERITRCAPRPKYRPPK